MPKEQDPEKKETKDHWTIAALHGGNPLSLKEPPRANNPVITAVDVTDFDADIVAHPFISKKGDQFYMFFTAKYGPKDEGGIGLAESSDGIDWKYNQMVVKEDFVLSYPYIIEDNGEVYMMPESHSESSIRLYKATDFPTKWEFQKNIMEGRDFISSSMIKHQNNYYIFTSDKTNGHLDLYYASDIKGPYQIHPSSLIVSDDSNIARPAGRVLNYNGEIYRLAQDCEPSYGNSVVAFRITSLSPTEYAEDKVLGEVLRSDGEGWNQKAAHHLDAVQLENGTWVGVTDGCENK